MLKTELRNVLRSSVAGLVLASGGLLAAPATTHAQNRIECFADFDKSGSLDIFDFLGFQNAFAAGDLRADCDLDGRLTIFDFLCFQNAFAEGQRFGCPAFKFDDVPDRIRAGQQIEITGDFPQDLEPEDICIGFRPMIEEDFVPTVGLRVHRLTTDRIVATVLPFEERLIGPAQLMVFAGEGDIIPKGGLSFPEWELQGEMWGWRQAQTIPTRGPVIELVPGFLSTVLVAGTTLPGNAGNRQPWSRTIEAGESLDICSRMWAADDPCRHPDTGVYTWTALSDQNVRQTARAIAAAIEAMYLAVPPAGDCDEPIEVIADAIRITDDFYEIRITFTDGALIDPVGFPWCQSVCVN
ncbi:MAG: hypothetical protein NCW75_03395 [Phycisphaera sp.]|nr:MAG: hypothetical protein NCW75_03395 [Phycisphaera sp.]